MSLNSIETVNQDQLKKLLEYLQWKLKHNSLNVDEVQISRYLNITTFEAEDMMNFLFDRQAIEVERSISCPDCFMNYTINEMAQQIICVECGSEIIPARNKRLIRYFYKINEQCKLLKENDNQTKPRKSLISRIDERNDSITMKNKVKVFLSYTHTDEKYKNKLNVHFAPLKRCNKVETWNDRELIAGTKFDAEIKKHLNEDEIIILLISADFIASDYCYDIEMKRALEREKNGECTVIPIILRDCLWQITPLKDLLALPKDGKPISTFVNEDEAYLQIVKAVNDIIDNF